MIQRELSIERVKIGALREQHFIPFSSWRARSKAVFSRFATVVEVLGFGHLNKEVCRTNKNELKEIRSTFRFATQAGSSLVTRPWNGGPPATFRLMALATDSPALAGAAIAAAHAQAASAAETPTVPFKEHLSPVRRRPSVIAPERRY
jgi:hypothetical protein